MPMVRTVPFEMIVEEVPVLPEFFPEVAPPSVTVRRGVVAAYQISFRTVAGFANPISLAVLGLPPGAVATFSANPALPTDVVGLMITSDTAPAGSNQMILEGTEVEPV